MQESFIEIFSKILEINNAVASIRPLIFELATQGKIVEQIPQEESISVSISQIVSNIEDTRSKNALRGDPVTRLNLDTLPQIPSSWMWVPLGNVADYGSSKKFDSSEIPDDAWLLDLEDIEKDTSRLVQKKNFRDNPSKSTKAAFSAGDVLYGKLRPYLNKVIVADSPGFCTTEIIPIRSLGLIDPAYLCLALRRPSFVAYANSKSYGMNLPRLSTSDARNAPIPLPPLAEQKRIVAKVEELMGLCDVLEAQQQEREERKTELVRSSLSRFAESPTSENLGYLFHHSYDIPPSELRKSILTLAVQGKLVPQDPEDEPAGELIDRLEHERASLATEQGVRLPKKVLPINDDSNPHALPETWRWSRIGQLALVIDYGTSQKANNDTLGVPVYRMGNIVGGRLIADGLKYVDPSIDDLPSLFLKTDDILFNRTNSYELVGKAGIFTGPDNVATFASYLIRIRLPSNFLLSSFFNIAMNAPYFRRTQIEPEVVQQCGQANFNGTKLASTIVPVPPLAEQHRIVAKVDQLMALVDELERQQAASREKASNLLDAIVHEMTSAG